MPRPSKRKCQVTSKKTKNSRGGEKPSVEYKDLRLLEREKESEGMLYSPGSKEKSEREEGKGKGGGGSEGRFFGGSLLSRNRMWVTGLLFAKEGSMDHVIMNAENLAIDFSVEDRRDKKGRTKREQSQGKRSKERNRKQSN